MNAKKFSLWMGCLGNGVTVCNSAVMESGDYKHIAHISPAGNITLYVNRDYIPCPDYERMERTAARMRGETRARIRADLRSGSYGYRRILEECCDYTPYSKWSALMDAIKGKSDDEKFSIIEDFYIKNF